MNNSALDPPRRWACRFPQGRFISKQPPLSVMLEFLRTDVGQRESA